MEEQEIEYWFSTENGAHIPVRKGQTKESALNDFLKEKGDDRGKSTEELKKQQVRENHLIIEDKVKEATAKKLTPAEKIASVHIDFDKDNILPELNEEDLVKIGSKVNKPVLLKKNIIDRNAVIHMELTNEDFQNIIANALYSPSEIFSAHKNKPYFHFAKVIEVNSKGKPEIGLALLDVDANKDNFEIVHAHFARTSSYETIKRKK